MPTNKLLDPIAALGGSRQEIYAVLLQNTQSFLKAEEIAEIINADRVSSDRTQRRVTSNWIRQQVKELRSVVAIESSKSKSNPGYKLQTQKN